jgi:hypothetical protein
LILIQAFKPQVFPIVCSDLVTPQFAVISSPRRIGRVVTTTTVRRYPF